MQIDACMITYMIKQHFRCVFLYIYVQAETMYLHEPGKVPFSLFSSLNGKRLSAILFCQQLGDAFLQLAAICFNYTY